MAITTENQPKPVASPTPITAFQITQPETGPNWIKALIYGPYGAGKTTFAASAAEVPAMQRVLFVDAESGSMSLSGMDIDVVRINKYSQLARIYEFLRLHCRWRDSGETDKLRQLEERFRGPIPSGVEPKQYNTVVIDSLTEVQKYCMYSLLNIEFTTENIKLDNVVDTPQFKEWGESAEMIRLLIRSFRDLPMHVIFVCSEQEKDDENRVIRRPNLPGKLAGESQGFFDVVGYLRSAVTNEGEVARRLYLRAGPNFVAKHRFRGVDAAHLDNPTMTSLLELKEQAKK